MEDHSDLAGLAMALTGDRVRAAALIARATPASSTGLVQTFLHTRAAPDQSTPDREPLDPELEDIAQRLGRLTPSARAAVTLAFGRRMTYAEIAGLLERTPVKIAGLMAQTTADLDADDYAITATLEQLAWQVPDDTPLARARHVASRERRRHRRRLTAVAGGVALAVVAAVAIPAIRAHQPLYHRPVGEWSYGPDITPPEGWRIAEHGVGTDVEYLGLNRGRFESIDRCEVVAVEKTSKFQLEHLVPAASRKIPIGVVDADAGPISGSGIARFQVEWSYSLDSAVRVNCTSSVPADAQSRAIDTARRLRFKPTPIRVPIALPQKSKLAPNSIGHIGNELWISFNMPDRDVGSVIVAFDSALQDGQSRPIQSAGREALMTIIDGATAVCIPRSTPHVCVNATIDEGDGSSSKQAAKKAQKRALDFAAQLRLAPSMTDRSTWFDAKTALPH